MQAAQMTAPSGALGAGFPSRTEQDAVWSKINWRIVPVILIAYIMAFLDRINVGYAKLTMQQDLQLSDEVYGLGAGIFFITYLLFEVPSNLRLEKIGARRTFLRIMVLWGLTSAATAFTAPALPRAQWDTSWRMSKARGAPHRMTSTPSISSTSACSIDATPRKCRAA